MSVRSRRLAIAAVAAATAIAIPTAALASGSSMSSGKPAPSAAATKPAAASKPAAANKSGVAGGSAAASKSAARQSEASSSSTMSAFVAALATRLGVGHGAAQRALNQVQALGMAGIDPASPAFAAIAHDLGVSPSQLAGALYAAKQSLAGK